MCLDQNTILIIVAAIGVGGYAAQNLFIRWRELSKREYERREERYSKINSIIGEIYSPPITTKMKVPDKLKRELNIEYYLLQLYAPDKVVKAMYEFLDQLTPEPSDEELKKALQKLLHSMRKDLLGRKTKLKESEIEITRAV